MGPWTVNAWRSTVDSQCRGTTIICYVADLSRCLPTTSVTGVQQWTRYCGALPCRHLCTMTPSLYVIRSATSSQCKSSCKIWVELSCFTDDACGSVHNTLQGVSDRLRGSRKYGIALWDTCKLTKPVTSVLKLFYYFSCDWAWGQKPTAMLMTLWDYYNCPVLSLLYSIHS